MAILAFQKPDKVIMLNSDDKFGRFEFRPLEPGYGITVGNALRRILLSSLEGFAISSIKIDGIDHEFSSIPGVVEDVTEIILNLKQIRFKQIVSEEGEAAADEEKFTVQIGGKKKFLASDLTSKLVNFEILNPDLLIATMSKDVKFDITLTIIKGRGYIPAEENRSADQEFGVIAIDSIFTPIRNVKYAVENFRVEQKTDYEKLVFDIETDGSIHPKEALKEAAKILIFHFMLFSDEKIVLETVQKTENEVFDEEILTMRQLLKTKLVDMDLSVRALNCLKAAEVDTLGQLVTFSRADLLKFRNFGKKSLTELDDLLANLQLHFGMEVNKYKLDKD